MAQKAAGLKGRYKPCNPSKLANIANMELVTFDTCCMTSIYMHKSFTNHITITFPDTICPLDRAPINKKPASAVIVYTGRKIRGRAVVSLKK